MQTTKCFTKSFFWLGVLLPALLLGVIYRQGITYMVEKWAVDENYGHGFFILPIALYMVWERRRRLQNADLKGSWWGLPVILFGFGLYLIGELATLYVVLHLSLLSVLAGMILSAIGWRGMREVAFPFSFLLTMIPLPDFLYQGLSGRLQLISSKFGVGCLQIVGITAYREGNVIDLGPIQLQVVEACSGLRYLFPLATIALICAYLFKDRLWKRVLLFLSSFPISIFLNGFRIGVTGLLVDLFGEGPAEGFFHGFSGWLLFTTSLFLLFLEMWWLGQIGAKSRGKRRSLVEMFGQDLKPEAADPRLEPGGPRISPGRLAPSYLFSLALLAPALVASTQIVSREEVFPPRQSFFDFPMRVGEWEGKTAVMDPVYAEALRFDDYLLADYHAEAEPPVNLYAAYYRSQKKGQSAHSPSTCIPGDGWEIVSLNRLEIPAPGRMGGAMAVNRVVIQKGEARQVVFYWFQQRGRMLTNEYLVKFYLFWDAIAKNRTDGALVRLTSAIPPGEDESTADRRLTAFAKEAGSLLERYIPGEI